MPVEPTPEQMVRHLRRTNDVARRTVERGYHPFGAVLIGPDHEQVLAEQGNIGVVEHAESTLALAAAKKHAPAFLWTCTLYTNIEPCAMCSGTIYWANIGRVVFAVSEARLLELTGNHPENPTLNVSARYVFERGQKPIRLYGPIADAEAETLALHKEFWKR